MQDPSAILNKNRLFEFLQTSLEEYDELCGGKNGAPGLCIGLCSIYLRMAKSGDEASFPGYIKSPQGKMELSQCVNSLKVLNWVEMCCELMCNRGFTKATSNTQPVHTTDQYIDSVYGPENNLKLLETCGFGIINVYIPAGYSHALAVCVRNGRITLFEPNMGGFSFDTMNNFIAWVKMYIKVKSKTTACLVLGFKK